MRKSSDKITARERSRIPQNLLVSSRRHQLAAVFSRARTKIENPVRRAHDVRIVLHHQNRISQIAQVLQDLDQPVRVAAVQPNRRLVQHIQRAHQPRSQRSRQLNPLRLASGKRRRQPVERQIFQTHIVQKAQPLADLLQQAARRSPLPPRSTEPRQRTSPHPPPSCAQTSQIFFPLIFTCRASSRSRVPRHSGQVEYPRYRLRKTRTCSLYFFRSRY